MLEKISFTWDVLEYQWDENYRKLKEFYAKEGHSSVPYRLGSLRNWVVKQRRNYEMGKLSPEKIALLKKIEFQWKLKN